MIKFHDVCLEIMMKFRGVPRPEYKYRDELCNNNNPEEHFSSGQILADDRGGVGGGNANIVMSYIWVLFLTCSIHAIQLLKWGHPFIMWAPSSEFVSSSIPSWQSLTAHAQPFRAFCLKVPLDSLLVWASSEGSGETARMRRLAWTFAARIWRLAPNSLDTVHVVM